MQAIIMAAGYGTRLYPLTKEKAKALLPVCGKPIMQYIVEDLLEIDEVEKIHIVCNQSFHEQFVSWLKEFKKNRQLSKEITLTNDGTTSNETRLGGTKDLDLAIKKHKINDDILVLFGDNITDFGLKGFIDFSLEKKGLSILVYDVENKEQARKYGVVSIDENKKITKIEEKPKRPESTLIVTGIYYFPKRYLEFIKKCARENKHIEGATLLIKDLFGQGEKVFGFPMKGVWKDIGTIEDYQKAEELFK